MWNRSYDIERYFSYLNPLWALIALAFFFTGAWELFFGNVTSDTCALYMGIGATIFVTGAMGFDESMPGAPRPWQPWTIMIGIMFFLVFYLPFHAVNTANVNGILGWLINKLPFAGHLLWEPGWTWKIICLWIALVVAAIVAGSFDHGDVVVRHTGVSWGKNIGLAAAWLHWCMVFNQAGMTAVKWPMSVLVELGWPLSTLIGVVAIIIGHAAFYNLLARKGRYGYSRVRGAGVVKFIGTAGDDDNKSADPKVAVANLTQVPRAAQRVPMFLEINGQEAWFPTLFRRFDLIAAWMGQDPCNRADIRPFLSRRRRLTPSVVAAGIPVFTVEVWLEPGMLELFTKNALVAAGKGEFATARHIENQDWSAPFRFTAAGVEVELSGDFSYRLINPFALFHAANPADSMQSAAEDQAVALATHVGIATLGRGGSVESLAQPVQAQAGFVGIAGSPRLQGNREATRINRETVRAFWVFGVYLTKNGLKDTNATEAVRKILDSRLELQAIAAVLRQANVDPQAINQILIWIAMGNAGVQANVITGLQNQFGLAPGVAAAVANAAGGGAPAPAPAAAPGAPPAGPAPAAGPRNRGPRRP